jgi:Bacterial SH3 domain
MTIRQLLFVALLIISPLISLANDYYTAKSDLKVRKGAGKEYPVSFTLPKGERVEVISQNGTWYEIKYSGKTGYVNSKYLKSLSSDTKMNTYQQSENSNSGLSTLIFLGLIVFVWFLPILIIMSSGKTTSGEKTAWILAVLFISWFAWFFYILLAPIKKKD